MLANLLIVLGIALLVLGGYLKYTSATGKSSEPAAPIEAAAPKSAANTDEEKGRQFEDWVVERFPKRSFELKDWRGDKITANGRFAESTRNPDLSVDLVLGTNRYVFAVECKWRQKFNDGLIAFAKPEQVERYRTYAQENKRPVFIVLGVDGSATGPSELYIIPLTDARNGTLSATDLKPYKQSMSRTGFFYEPLHNTLKY